MALAEQHRAAHATGKTTTPNEAPVPAAKQGTAADLMALASMTRM